MNKNDINKDITSTERWIYLDICKIIAIFLVVVMHVVSGSWGVVPMGSGDWHTINVWNVFSRFGIPLFFMLTGAIFLNEKKEVTVKKLYSRYLFRIVTAFLFWSFINMMIYYLQRRPFLKKPGFPIIYIMVSGFSQKCALVFSWFMMC